MPSRKGSPNKNSKFLLTRLKDMYGDDFEPMIKAAENAIRMQDIANTGGDDEFNMRKECVSAWEKIGQYTNHKLKAVEISGDEESPLSGKWTVEFVNATPKD